MRDALVNMLLVVVIGLPPDAGVVFAIFLAFRCV